MLQDWEGKRKEKEKKTIAAERIRIEEINLKTLGLAARTIAERRNSLLFKWSEVLISERVDVRKGHWQT